MMEEWTTILSWVFIVFLIINTMMVFITTNEDYLTYIGDIQNVEQIQGFLPVGSTTLSIFGIYDIDCSVASSNALDWGPCFLNNATQSLAEFTSGIGRFLGGWNTLLDLMFPNWIPGSTMFKGIVVPLLSILQFMGLFAILLKIAGIIRGGS